MGNSLKLLFSKCIDSIWKQSSQQNKQLPPFDDLTRNDVSKNQNDQNSNQLSQRLLILISGFEIEFKQDQSYISKLDQTKNLDDTILSEQSTKKPETQASNSAKIYKNDEENIQLIMVNGIEVPNEQILSPETQQNESTYFQQEIKNELSPSQIQGSPLTSEPPMSQREIIKEIRTFETVNFEQLSLIGKEALETFQILKDDISGFDKTNEAGILIRNYQSSQKLHITVFNIEFTMKGTINQYNSIYNDPVKLKQFDAAIDTYEIKFQNEAIQLIYLKYKKVLFIDARDYLYVKYSEQVNENELIEVCKSVNILDMASQNEGQKKTNLQRGEILLTGIHLKQIDAENISFKVYMEINMKNKLPPNMTKKSYLQEIRRKIEKMQLDS